ncbi:MAG: PepSY domain-containing protein [Gemmatimonadota bacterium]
MTESTEAARSAARTKRHRRHRPRSDGIRNFSRWTFHIHLWAGVVITVLILVVSVTGIALNHKRGLGLMPEVQHTPAAAFEDALPLAELARHATAAVGAAGEAGVDRMDVRPDDGIVKVRFNDREVHEATVVLATGEVLHVGLRNDVFMEKLHSGEIFGAQGILLSDLAAVGLTLLVLSGFWIWLYPRSRV